MVIPYEVYDALDGKALCVWCLYFSILRYQYIYEDWDSDPVWVVGYIRTSKTDLFTKAPISEGSFYDTAWPGLVNADLVDVTPDGRIILKRYKKKQDVGVSPSEVADLRSRIEQLENVIRNSGASPDGTPGGNCQSESSEFEGNPSEFEGNPSDIEEASCARESLSGDLDIDIDPEEEEARRGEVAAGQGKTLTFRGNGQENFLTQSYKTIVNALENIWPGRGVKLPQDADYLVALHGFQQEDIDEALAAAKKHKIMYGNYDWILNRLQNPELFRGNGGKKSRPRRETLDNENFGRLNCDWLNIEEA